MITKLALNNNCFTAIFISFALVLFNCSPNKYKGISYKHLISMKIDSVKLLVVSKEKESAQSEPGARKYVYEYDTIRILPQIFVESIKEVNVEKAYSKKDRMDFLCIGGGGRFVINNCFTLRIPCLPWHSEAYNRNNCKIEAIFNDEDSLRLYSFCLKDSSFLDYNFILPKIQKKSG
ncbi:MAG TPA: hypothetical protein VLX68_08870 [Chitinivibrionales bacterium]|nr:hypothetical protein [Chitinivibrionales bacterium]